jgi:hypothetical protein
MRLDTNVFSRSGPLAIVAGKKEPQQKVAINSTEGATRIEGGSTRRRTKSTLLLNKRRWNARVMVMLSSMEFRKL